MGRREATTASLKIAVHPPSDGRELPAMSDQPPSSSVRKPGVQLNASGRRPCVRALSASCRRSLAEQHDNGLSGEEAIHKACLLGFPPIPMTTVAALLGSVPLMLGTGQGRNFGSRSAMRLSAACSSSQLLTLFTTLIRLSGLSICRRAALASLALSSACRDSPWQVAPLGVEWHEIAFDSARIGFTWPRVLSERYRVP